MNSNPTTPGASSRRTEVLRGGFMMAGVSVVSRLSSLIAQLFLGRLLVEEDFGLFAVALGITGIGMTLRSVLQPVLVEYCENDPEAFDRTYRTTMASAWAAVVVLAALTPTIAELLDQPNLPPVLWVLLLVVPFQMLPAFGIAKVTHRLQFYQVSKALTVAGFGRHGITVALAFAGAGAFSLVAGVGFAAAAEYLLLRRTGSFLPNEGLLSWKTATDLLDSIRNGHGRANRRWVWLSALALTAAIQGDYTVASIWLSASAIGVYYFGYALSGAFFQPLVLAINTVIVPAFVAVKSNELRRQRLAETIGLLSVLGVLVFNATAVTIAPLTDFLWGGRWNESIHVLLIFTMLGPIQLAHSASLAISRGSGLWNFYLADILLTGSATLCGAALGSSLGSLSSLALSVVLADTAVTVWSLAGLSRRLGGHAMSALGHVLRPWLLGLPPLVLAHVVQPLDSPSSESFVLRTIVFAFATTLFVVVPYRSPLLSAAAAIRRVAPV